MFANKNDGNEGYQKSADSKPDDQSKSQSNKSSDAQLTVMLLSVAFAFVILSIPVYIRFIVFSFIDYRQDPYLYAIYILFHHFSSKSIGTNHAINFLLYCLSGSKFRQEVISLFYKPKT